MATLEKIRNRAGILIAVVIGLALFAFILQDVVSSGGSLFDRAQMEVAKVAGSSISYQQFQAQIDENENLQKLFSQQLSLDEQAHIQIRERVWQDILRSNIMQPEYKKLGLEIHEDELFDMVQGNFIHPIIQQQFANPQTGAVDKEYIGMIIKNLDNDPRARAYWMYIEHEVVKDRLFNKYLNLIRQGLYVTSLQSKRSVADRTALVNLDYVVMPYSAIADSTVKITNDDLKAYHKAHQNDYRQQASRDVEYVVFPIKASDEDVRLAEEWVNNAKAEFAASTEPKQFVGLKSDSPFDAQYHSAAELREFGDWALSASVGDVMGPVFDGTSYRVARLLDTKMMPDSVKARHVLIAPKGQAEQERTAARNTADSLLNILKKGGSWSAIASRYSDDPGSKDKGGDLGWYPSGAMESNFDEASFSNKKGEVKLVETRYGFHILEVTDRGKEHKKAQLAILERKVSPSSQTTQTAYAKAAQFAGLNKTYEKFNAAANENGLTKRIANDLLQNDRNIAGLESPRELVRWAFRSNQGDVSTVFELGDAYVVAVLTRIREEGIAPLDQVADDVRVKAIREKKAVILSERAKGAMQSNDINEVAKALNTTVAHAENVSFSSYTLPSAGIEPDVIGTATAHPEGKLAGPIKGNSGVYVLTVASSTREEGDVTAEQLRLNNMYRSRAFYEAYEALKANAKIIDKRYNFY